MINRLSIRANKRAFAALVAASFVFALVQSVAAAHAVKFGTAPHTHQGQVCVLSLAAPGGDKAAAPSPFVLFVALAFTALIAPPSRTAPATKPVPRPVSRGPPSI